MAIQNVFFTQNYILKVHKKPITVSSLQIERHMYGLN